MKCLILAAGYATRLYPLTENFPKPLLDVAGKTILDWLVDDIETIGQVDEYILISNHKFASHFEAWRATKPQNITVLDDGTTSNENRLGAVCDIKFAIDALSLDDDVLIIAGDNILDFSLAEFVKYAISKGASAIMRYHEPRREQLIKAAVLTTDTSDLIISMEEKPGDPKAEWCAPPFYFYTREDMKLLNEAIASGCGTDAPGSFAAWLARKRSVYAMAMPGSRYDIGTLESYRSVSKSYQGIKRSID